MIDMFNKPFSKKEFKNFYDKNKALNKLGSSTCFYINYVNEVDPVIVIGANQLEFKVTYSELAGCNTMEAEERILDVCRFCMRNQESKSGELLTITKETIK